MTHICVTGVEMWIDDNQFQQVSPPHTVSQNQHAGNRSDCPHIQPCVQEKPKECCFKTMSVFVLEDELEGVHSFPHYRAFQVRGTHDGEKSLLQTDWILHHVGRILGKPKFIQMHCDRFSMQVAPIPTL